MQMSGDIMSAGKDVGVDLSESAMIDCAKRGDESAYEKLYRHHKARVYAWCFRMTGKPADAEDLTQEVFLQLYRKLKSFRGDSSLSTWLYRVTTNIVLMHYRKSRVTALSLDVLEGHDQASVGADLQDKISIMIYPVDRVALTRAIGSLPKGRRSVYVLHDIKGLSHRDIARHMGFSVNTSKSQLHRARVILRATLDRNESRPTRQVKTKYGHDEP
jgi:RNA polymerase sigma-70 factor (ECF subfamily)